MRDLHYRAGLIREPRDTWPGLWTDNPVWASTDPKPSIGWVLESLGEIVGFLGNIPTLCRYGDKTLVAAAASGFAVDPAYRGYGLLLASAFYKQKNVDILLNTSANEVAAMVCQRFKAAPLPQPDYDKILFWVLRPRPFVAAALRKAGFNSTFACLSSVLPAVFLRTYIAVRGRRPLPRKSNPHTPLNISLIDSSEVGSEFDDLWNRKINEDTRFLNYRTPEVLRWHFSRQSAKVVCCHRGAELIGYAVVVRDDKQNLGLARSRIADIFVEKDDPKVINRLLEGTYQYAMSVGSHVLEVMGFPPSIREVILRNGPYSRSGPTCLTSFEHGTLISNRNFISRINGTHVLLMATPVCD